MPCERWGRFRWLRQGAGVVLRAPKSSLSQLMRLSLARVDSVRCHTVDVLHVPGWPFCANA